MMSLVYEMMKEKLEIGQLFHIERFLRKLPWEKAGSEPDTPVLLHTSSKYHSPCTRMPPRKEWGIKYNLQNHIPEPAIAVLGHHR